MADSAVFSLLDLSIMVRCRYAPSTSTLRRCPHASAGTKATGKRKVADSRVYWTTSTFRAETEATISSRNYIDSVGVPVIRELATTWVQLQRSDNPSLAAWIIYRQSE